MIYVQLLILCFVIVIIWFILTNFRHSKESMRTIPMPNPNYNPNVTVIDGLPTGKNQRVDINKEIDNMFNLYFDQNNIPTDEALILYSKYFVNNGNISIQNKMRLKDICYYIINFVIPSIPSQDNPTPALNWPYIEFLSNTLTPFTISSGPNKYSPFMMYEITPSDYNDAVGNGLNGPGSSTGPGADGNDGSNSSSSTSPGSSNGSLKNSDGSCGCPTSCFSNILDAVMNPKAAPGVSTNGSSSSSSSSWGSSSSSPGSKTPGGFGANGELGSDISGSALSKSGMSSLLMDGSQLRITYEKQTKPKGPLNSNVDGFVNNYFGLDSSNPIVIGKPAKQMMMPDELVPSDFKLVSEVDKQNKLKDLILESTLSTPEPSVVPTVFGKVEFSDFLKTRTLIDRLHKNRLYDLVYYFMENILPGLPTDNVPYSYVEWRPIVWSTVSFV